MFNRTLVGNVILAVALLLTTSGLAAADSILHDFKGDDGEVPHSPVTLDAAGNLYGTTFEFGPNGQGTVFKLSANADGTRTYTLLHSFPAFAGDGFTPSSGVSFDAAGNLYGTTASGGDFGVGTLYQISPLGQYKVLHSFSRHGGDGVMPYTMPVVDSSGNVYSATLEGGSSDEGVVLQLSPQPDGSWKENIIYNLPQSPGPQGKMDIVLGSDGALYVSRSTGGPNGSGLIFKLATSDGQTWSRTTLHNFSVRGSGDPSYPSGIVLDASGNIFGVSTYGGSADEGALFELPRRDDGTYGRLQLIHSFAGGKDGVLPAGSPALDGAGNIYGTALAGGVEFCGIVYKFSPTGTNGWTGTLLHNFGGQPDGARPEAGPTVDAAGNIFGTTSSGGAFQGGTVWQLTP